MTVPTTSSPRECSAPTSSRRRSSTSRPRWRRSVSTLCSPRRSIPGSTRDLNRPALAQTFTDLEAGGEVTVVVNHLKSKGSACAGDPDTGDGSGNCNVTRTLAAEALADWLASDPTGQGAGNELIIGDLNSYDKEDPIDAFRAAGYTDLVLRVPGRERLLVRVRRSGRVPRLRARRHRHRRSRHGSRAVAHQLRRAEPDRLRHDVQEAGAGRALGARRVALERPRPGRRRASTSTSSHPS